MWYLRVYYPYKDICNFYKLPKNDIESTIKQYILEKYSGDKVNDYVRNIISGKKIMIDSNIAEDRVSFELVKSCTFKPLADQLYSHQDVNGYFNQSEEIFYVDNITHSWSEKDVLEYCLKE